MNNAAGEVDVLNVTDVSKGNNIITTILDQ